MIDPINKFCVSVTCGHDGRVLVLNPPRAPLTRAEAMVFAAWLAVLAECLDADEGADETTFAQAYEAVRST